MPSLAQPGAPLAVHCLAFCLALCFAFRLGAVRGAEIPLAADACLPGLAETTPSGAFIALDESPAIVQDLRTNLQWQRCALGQEWREDECVGRPRAYTWEAAMAIAAREGEGWRLPSGRELQGIVERCHPAPAINPQVFPNTLGAFYWSASKDSGGLGRAWAVSFHRGSPYRMSREQEAHVRLVRDLPAPAPPAPPEPPQEETPPAAPEPPAPAAQAPAEPGEVAPEPEAPAPDAAPPAAPGLAQPAAPAQAAPEQPPAPAEAPEAEPAQTAPDANAQPAAQN
ncbi:MAG: DUF1566 domain-containing protein [Chromatiaceae bacterium]|nr:DUF1566 domain-containing protein [Chromatiaceae bacterium]